MSPTADVISPRQSAHVGLPPAAPRPNLRAAARRDTAKREDDKPRTYDELLRSRARSAPNLPVLYYPSSGIDYVGYTFQQLDVFAYRVAKELQKCIPTRADSSAPRRVVALLGPSNLEYLVTLMAVIKLGHTVLFLSTRISPVAIESLARTTGTEYLIADGKFAGASETVRTAIPELQVLPMPTRSGFEFPVEGHLDTQLDKGLDTDVEMNQVVYIIHSSGSTGLPKPIYQRQIAGLSNAAGNMNMAAFITLPLYHNHGLANWYRAMYSRKPIHMYNADLPLTSDYLSKIIRANRFEIFYGVPYALKLLVESDDGIQLLAQFKVVMYGGSACPDELGDKLVHNGVNLISHYGATEVGQLMLSSRPAGDDAWNYVRENEKIAPFLRWIPQGPNIYECCVLAGWPAKTATNMEDGSYRTKDLFEPHPTIPRAWKYIARADDTIVLVNGEKFNPVVTEGRIKSNPLVAEAVLFGAQQPYLGVLVVPSAATTGKTPAEVRELVWPGIEAAQQANDAFAKLSKEMVVMLPHGIDYPRTDKGSVIRQAFYRNFAAEMALAYASANSNSSGARHLTVAELKDFLRGLVAKTSQNAPFEDDTDFFALGFDSLVAIQMRVELLRQVKTDRELPQNVVFDHPSINRLATYLLGTHGDEAGNQSMSIEQQMEVMIDKYTDFAQEPGPCVVVTGTTGSLGAHIAAVFAQEPLVERVYCLVRAGSREHAQQRVMSSLQARKVWGSLDPTQQDKLVALPSDLARADLGLEPAVYQQIASSLRAVVHSAWSVNFQLQLSSFEKDNIAGVRHLLALCQPSAGRGPASAAFHFCSSVSAVARHPDALGPVPEALAETAWAQELGYAHAKLVAEHICARAASRAGVPVGVLRIGQIVADTTHGVWNATEAVPLLLQSALTVGALPALPERVRWLPVDVVARGVAEIALAPVPLAAAAAAADGAAPGRFLVANIVNRRSFGWKEDLLPALRAAGLEFDEVGAREWVRRLRASDPDPVANAPFKLVDFFAHKYDHDEEGLPRGKDYVTTQACAASPALANAPLLDKDFVKRFIEAFLAGPWRRPQGKGE